MESFTADFRYPRAPTPRRQMQHFKTESWRLPSRRLRGPEINHGCWKSVTSLEAKPEARPHSRAVVGKFHDFTRYRTGRGSDRMPNSTREVGHNVSEFRFVSTS